MPSKTVQNIAELWPAAAIGGGLFLASKVVFGAFGDGMTAEQRAARAQTNSGAPVTTPGDVLVGEPDYIKIYKGQKVDALRRFGEGPSSNNHAYPVTPRSYAIETVARYWEREISRLCGLSGRTLGGLGPFDEVSTFTDGDHPPPLIFGYRGMVNLESAAAILDGWNRIRPRLLAAILDGASLRTAVTDSAKPLTTAGTIAFWDEINRLAILVDVDRAVPDSAGIAWESLYEAAIEAPGVLGDAIAKVASEASGALWQVFGRAILNVAFSPIGLGVAGALAWLYRAELGALYRRVV